MPDDMTHLLRLSKSHRPEVGYILDHNSLPISTSARLPIPIKPVASAARNAQSPNPQRFTQFH